MQTALTCGAAAHGERTGSVSLDKPRTGAETGGVSGGADGAEACCVCVAHQVRVVGRDAEAAGAGRRPGNLSAVLPQLHPDRDKQHNHNLDDGPLLAGC